jgi:hypothetical protein
MYSFHVPHVELKMYCFHVRDDSGIQIIAQLVTCRIRCCLYCFCMAQARRIWQNPHVKLRMYYFMSTMTQARQIIAKLRTCRINAARTVSARGTHVGYGKTPHNLIKLLGFLWSPQWPSQVGYAVGPQCCEHTDTSCVPAWPRHVRSDKQPCTMSVSCCPLVPHLTR